MPYLSFSRYLDVPNVIHVIVVVEMTMEPQLRVRSYTMVLHIQHNQDFDAFPIEQISQDTYPFSFL